MSVAERQHDHRALAGRLVDEWEIDGCAVLSLLDLLDYLAIVGARLAPLTPDDFTDDGVSIASRAYFDEIRRLTSGVPQ